MNDDITYDYGEPEMLRKITNKTVMTKEFLDGPKPKESQVLYTLFGIIRDVTPGDGDFGPFLKFRGDFKAYNHVEEKVYRAPSAIVPAPMDDVLNNQFEAAKAAQIDPETGEIKGGAKKLKFQFIIDVGYKPSDSPTGYEWTTATRVKLQESDEMLALERSLAGIEYQEGDEE